MTAHRDLKHIIRQRQLKTGESYTAARAHVMRERATRLGLPPPPAPSVPATPTATVEAVVLRVNRQSARIRILGEEGQVTLHARDLSHIVPGHVVTLAIQERWTWRGDARARGELTAPRIDVDKLGLVPLPLESFGLMHLREGSDPYPDSDPYAPLWQQLTARPRHAYDMDPIAWGAFPDTGPDEDPVDDAMDVAAAGEASSARGMLMELLGRDLRCLDAHAHLGYLEFDDDPRRALLHYEIGVRIGELSLPPGFDGVLIWGRIWNRPFLRCLRGQGLCLWRLGDLAQARRVFERVLALNPEDQQGVRSVWREVCEGRAWMADIEPSVA